MVRDSSDYSPLLMAIDDLLIAFIRILAWCYQDASTLLACSEFDLLGLRVFGCLLVLNT
jgi:hypothetical protein